MDGYDKKTEYIPHIDGLRALAVIIVLLFHLDPNIFPGGYLGVDIFFVISGFVITRSLFNEYLSNGKISVTNFYLRRLKRLYPALLLMIFVTTVLYIFAGFLWDTNLYLKSALSAIFAASNFYFIFKGDNYFHQDLVNPLIHTWSLGVEEQFYFIYPALIFLGFYLLKKTKLRVTTLASFILGTSVILYAYFIFNQGNIWGSFYSPVARFWELGLGCALFLFTNKSYLIKNTKIYLLIFSVLIIFITFFQKTLGNIYLETLIATVSACVLIYAGLKEDSKIKELFTNKFSVYIGKISYSLYLWHMPVIYFFNLYLDKVWVYILSPIVSILCASASYHFFEKPIRFSKRFDKAIVFSIKILPAVLILLATIVFVFGFSNFKLLINNSFNKISEEIKKVNYIEVNFNLGDRIRPNFEINGNALETCSDYDTTFEVNDFGLISDCLKKEDSKTLFYLTGDSHALHFTNAFDNSEIIRNLYFVEIPRQSIVKENSKDFNQEWSDFVLEEQRSELERVSKEYEEIYYVTSLFLSPWQDQSQTIEKNLEKYIETLSPYAKLVFIAPTPVFSTGPESCVLLDKYCFIDKGDDLKRREYILNLYKSFESKYENIYVYDPYEFICPGEVCNIYNKEKDLLIYMDKDHISPEFSKTIAPHLDVWLKEELELKSY